MPRQRVSLRHFPGGSDFGGQKLTEQVELERQAPASTTARFILLGIFAFIGAAASGVIYHALTCQRCKEARGEEALVNIAVESARLNQEPPVD